MHDPTLQEAVMERTPALQIFRVGALDGFIQMVKIAVSDNIQVYYTLGDRPA